MKRVLIVLGVVAALMAAVLPVVANHPPSSDAGVDIPNIGAAMNQESYWESYFDGAGFSVECTKYLDHSGFIPAVYDAAVVKDGDDLVRVYSDLTGVGAFTALGPANPNAQHPNRRHEAPHSWVMKCTFEEDVTTTTVADEEPTTTFAEETTTTLDEGTTTTTVDDSSTTTVGQETTTTAGGSTTTTEPPTYVCEAGEVVEVLPGDPGYPGPVTDPRLVECDVVDTTVTTAPTLTTVTTAPEELPFTGASSSLLILAAGVLLSVGGLVLRSVRGEG